MNAITIDTTPEKLLEYRSAKNKEIFMDYENSKLYFYCNTGEGFILKAHIPNPKAFKHLFQYMNKPLIPESLMIASHDFAQTANWPAAGEAISSIFTCAPFTGYKLMITSIVTRFPTNIDLSSNPLTFTVWKYVPPYGVIPVISQAYYSIEQLLLQSNSPWYTVEFAQDLTFSGKMIEVKFRYTDSDMANTSKLELYASRGEKITVSLVNDEPLTNSEGLGLDDPCYAIFNTKRVIEF
ncbi:MAG: hypothetical protein U9Q40_05655 [Campylobacterota bacterium]|nr:hypothetical protein [Campylobacterota bacterium]